MSTTILVVCLFTANQPHNGRHLFAQANGSLEAGHFRNLSRHYQSSSFSSEGYLIGDKRSLQQLIHEVTCIPVDALQNCPINKYTIPERMKWAKNRETTEEEDIVYCLLGILNVFMPLSYGEGRAKAWERLKAEVGSSAQFIIPFSRNDTFVGHGSHLAELEAKLLEGKQAVTMAIAGPGGTGKSQLALELAYRIRDQNKNCSVFWIDGSSIDGIH